MKFNACQSTLLATDLKFQEDPKKYRLIYQVDEAILFYIILWILVTTAFNIFY
jgi:hypothetical protein